MRLRHESGMESDSCRFVLFVFDCSLTFIYADKIALILSALKNAPKEKHLQI